MAGLDFGWILGKIWAILRDPVEEFVKTEIKKAFAPALADPSVLLGVLPSAQADVIRPFLQDPETKAVVIGIIAAAETIALKAADKIDPYT